jgi:hypothetical protein
LPKRLWTNHFGHAGRDLLKIGDLTDRWDGFDKETTGKAMTPEAGRVHERFALSCHAGLLASRRGIVPWTDAQIRSASACLCRVARDHIRIWMVLPSVTKRFNGWPVAKVPASLGLAQSRSGGDGP